MSTATLEAATAAVLDPWELDVRIVAAGPIIDSFERKTSDNCGSSCQSACPATCK